MSALKAERLRQSGAHYAAVGKHTHFPSRPPGSTSFSEFMPAYGKRKRVTAKYTRPRKRARSASVKRRSVVSAPDARFLHRLRAGARKDAPDIAVSTSSQDSADAALKVCLTSSTAYNTAASGTGLLTASDSDKVRINSVWLKGHAYAVGATTAAQPPRLRIMVVWLYTSVQLASAAGTLPGCHQDVLVGTTDIDSIDLMTKQKGEVSSSFKILWDQTIEMGQASTGHGKIGHTIDIFVPINQTMTLKDPSTDTLLAGHYDSDESAGQITRGIPMLYVMADGATGQGVAAAFQRRLNYTSC